MIHTTEHLDIQGVEVGGTVRWHRQAEATPIMAIAGLAANGDEATIVDLARAASCLGWRLDRVERGQGGRLQPSAPTAALRLTVRAR